MTTTKTSTKRPQVEASEKALRVKRANDVRRAQPAWLSRESLSPPREDQTPLTPDRVNAAHRSQGPPRLLDRHEVCAIAGVSYPTLWARMRAGTFPRSRVAGGKSMWLSTEIEAWMSALPVRVLKGDDEEAE